MKINIAPGVFDILPNDDAAKWKSSYLWHYVESIIRKTAYQYGFEEIRTPLFERTELFVRGVGQGTDIVSKEMYTFQDKGERWMSLRPENTASVGRSFIENQLHQQSAIHKLYYMGPMFRYERTQAGRYRQHHQFGAEVIGIPGPEQDAEVIDLLYTLYRRLGLKHLSVDLNSIGSIETRLKYRDALKNYLHSSLSSLSAESQNRFETNPMRILDSKNENDRKILTGAPSILEFLDSESNDHFESVKTLLTQLKIPFKVNPQIVRGLDYYNRTVFEIAAGELGAQNAVGAGGRYDGLIKELGGPDLPAVGFATGIERILQVMLKQEVPLPHRYRPVLFMIPLGEEARKASFSLLHDLRELGLAAQMDFSGKKLGKVMQYADQIQAEYVTVLGDDELRNREVELKEMTTGRKFKIPLDELGAMLKSLKNQETY